MAVNSDKAKEQDNVQPFDSLQKARQAARSAAVTPAEMATAEDLKVRLFDRIQDDKRAVGDIKKMLLALLGYEQAAG